MLPRASEPSGLLPAGRAMDTHTARSVLRVRGGLRPAGPSRDELAEEVPVALEYNGISHATMMASPSELEDFAVGFSLTEGIVRGVQDIRDVEIVPADGGIVARLEIASACLAGLKTRRRALAGRTGCGLCGVESLEGVLQELRPLAAPPRPVALAAVRGAMAAMRARQRLHDLTGATHAAGWADADGELHLVREDVGRHNALDKVAGALARGGTDGAAGLAVISSRASFEMVQKAAAAGIPVLAAVSAPTALAVRLAERAGMALIGFLRQDDCTLYTHPGHLRG